MRIAERTDAWVELGYRHPRRLFRRKRDGSKTGWSFVLYGSDLPDCSAGSPMLPFDQREVSLTIDEVANFCEWKDCRVTVGDAELGFVHIDGRGVNQSSNYRRFLSLNELAALPSPKDVVEKATLFKIEHGGEQRSLSRDEFRSEYEKFLSLIEG